MVIETELSIRRDAYLALCMTREFQERRRRARQRSLLSDFSDDYRMPSGDLVRLLEARRPRDTRMHRREAVAA